MSALSGGKAQATRQCIHCGRQIRRHLQQCPYCREAQAEHRAAPTSSPKIQTHGHFRSGLLLMLLSLALHYFAGGYSPLTVPSEISSPVIIYVAPVVFLGGLTMSLWGFFVRVRA